MSIDGINTAMTPLQFSRARSASRAVETMEASVKRSVSSAGQRAAVSRMASETRSETSSRALVAPAGFHCTYRPVPGKPAAKREPQVADSAYWSFQLNRLG